MVRVSKQRIQIMRPESGHLEFLPVTFDEEHYGVANVVIHTALFDYKFRPIPLQYTDKEDMIMLTYSKDRIVKIPAYIPKSLEEILFFKVQEVAKLDPTYLEKIYNDYIQKLIDMQTKIKDHISKIREKYPIECLAVKSAIPGSVKAEPLNSDDSTLPGIASLSISEDSKEKPKITFANEESKEITSQKINSRSAWVLQAQKCESVQALSSHILESVHNWSNEILQIWNYYLELIIAIPHPLAVMLNEEFNKKRAELTSLFVHHSEAKVPAFSYQASRNVNEEHQELTKVIRENLIARGINDSIILKELSTYENLNQMPILFEDIQMKDEISSEASPPPIPEINKGKGLGDGHLIIFVHGYQGNSCDMRISKNVMFMRLPYIGTLCSVDNEGRTEGDIQEMGDRLAREVINYIKEWYTGNKLQRISFIGHSLGGVIIRTALPKLADYKDKMHVFMTLSSPHLGCMYSSSKLVGAGMWILKKWSTSKSLEQLEMTDHKDYSQTFMYKLSEAPGLEWFKHVFLFSSFLDYYSPYESSRIEIYKKVKSGSAKETAYMKMASNLLSKIRANALHRVDVAFGDQSISINSAIGREAHLQFLECEALHKIIAYRYANMFIR